MTPAEQALRLAQDLIAMDSTSDGGAEHECGQPYPTDENDFARPST